MGKNIVAEIDKATRALLTEAKPRSHLGASQIGGRCARQAWYGFRWAYQENALGRTRRLWDRGHEEEHRLVRWLRASGAEVRDYAKRLVWNTDRDDYQVVDWDDGFPQYCEDVSTSPAHHKIAAEEYDIQARQWGFTDHEGHFAGSSDGKIRWPGVLPDGWGGIEFKTHNEKSFKHLEQKGVLTSKPVHWVQMQIYMHYLGLPWTLYLAVNKNDDALYAEVVVYKPEMAGQYIDLARGIILAKQAPKKLTEDPSWFECRYCTFREICHYDVEPEKNCRSCVYADPVGDGGWNCARYGMLIPEDFIPKGCGDWTRADR